MGKWCLHAVSFIINRFIIKVAENQDSHKSLDKFDFGLDQTTLFVVFFSLSDENFRLSNMNISGASLPILSTFYM